MAERIDVLAVMDKAIVRLGAGWPNTQREMTTARAAAAGLIDFIRNADCNCRPETEHYAAHTCSRCELLARVGGAE